MFDINHYRFLLSLNIWQGLFSESHDVQLMSMSYENEFRLIAEESPEHEIAYQEYRSRMAKTLGRN